MLLSHNFSLEELIATDIRDADNEPSDVIIAKLRDTAESMEAVRVVLGNHPIIVRSGYRSPLVNARVGGAKNSAHMAGDAVDFLCPRVGSPIAVCRAIADSGLVFDQLISEKSWTHISFAPAMRKAMLTAHFGPDGITYTKGFS